MDELGGKHSHSLSEAQQPRAGIGSVRPLCQGHQAGYGGAGMCTPSDPNTVPTTLLTH